MQAPSNTRNSPPIRPTVAAGLLALVETHPANVAKMLSAPASETSGALVDRIAGVMAVNTLSAEAVLARFFSQDLLSEHLVERLEKSGKGNESVLAARIVAQWKPDPGGVNAKKRKSRGEQATEAANKLSAASVADRRRAADEELFAGFVELDKIMRAPKSAPTSVATGPRTAPTAHEPPTHAQARIASVSAAPAGVGSRQGLADLRSPAVAGAKTKSSFHDARCVTYDVSDARADVTDDGGEWFLSKSQDDLLTANWYMRRVSAGGGGAGDCINPINHGQTRTSPGADDRRLFYARDESSFLLRTKHFGVLRQGIKDFYQLTRQGVMYKVERGGCPLCCGDEIFLLTLEERSGKGGAGEAKKNQATMLSVPGDKTRALPLFRLRVDNWQECHCSGGTIREDETVDIGYVMDGVGPRDVAAHLIDKNRPQR